MLAQAVRKNRAETFPLLSMTIEGIYHGISGAGSSQEHLQGGCRNQLWKQNYCRSKLSNTKMSSSNPERSEKDDLKDSCVSKDHVVVA